MNTVFFGALFLLLALSRPAVADGDHAAPAESASSRVGPNRAVVAFDAENGFKMNEAALKRLGVQFGSITGKGPWKVSSSSVVRIKHSTGVYRRFEGWISFILVQVASREGDSVQIISEDLQSGDEISIAGASYLRLTEADLNADTVDSCSH